jgi:hypothetical protein
VNKSVIIICSFSSYDGSIVDSFPYVEFNKMMKNLKYRKPVVCGTSIVLNYKYIFAGFNFSKKSK